MRDKFYQFMIGRNGADELSRGLSVIACILIVIGIFTKISILGSLAVVLIFYSYFRIFSRNIGKRRAENDWYVRKKYALTAFFETRKSMASQRRDFRFYKCPSCRTTLRVPKGKGKIRITCRKCGTAFERKT